MFKISLIYRARTNLEVLESNFQDKKRWMIRIIMKEIQQF